jgi:acetolactate synthase-1/2/3 large subunit
VIKIKGGEVILEVLKRNGINTLFGYPGGAVIPFYDVLYGREDFNHYRSSHEQGAVHGADGYARATGKVGVSIATSGPGATNTITGIATAYMDSVPIVVITGQVPRQMLGRDSFQEIDITGLTMSVTKHNILVRDVNELEDAIQNAVDIANSGRKGPVLVDIPKDLFIAECEYKGIGSTIVSDESYEIEQGILEEVCKTISNSQKPIIYAGGGVKNGYAEEVLNKFVDKFKIPVVNTLMGLGAISRENPISLGLVGMHGFPEANLAVTNADLIISLGARFSDRVIGNAKEFQKNKKIIHVDIDRTEDSKNVKADIFVNMPVKEFINSIIEDVDVSDTTEWLREIESFKHGSENSNEKFSPESIIKCLNKNFSKNEIVVTDVGQHQMWTAQYFKFSENGKFITSGGLGTMGFGMGAAVGAKVGRPDMDVVLVTGDGSFRMNCNELTMVSEYQLPLTIVMMKNNTLGMVRQWQKMFQDKKYSETTLEDNVNYIKLLEAYGIKGVEANSTNELQNALKNRDKDKPFFVQCNISIDENVIPIVPPGKAIYNLILE